eukprot:1415791-Rhodomonas_salina.1
MGLACGRNWDRQPITDQFLRRVSYLPTRWLCAVRVYGAMRRVICYAIHERMVLPGKPSDAPPHATPGNARTGKTLLCLAMLVPDARTVKTLLLHVSCYARTGKTLPCYAYLAMLVPHTTASTTPRHRRTVLKIMVCDRFGTDVGPRYYISQDVRSVLNKFEFDCCVAKAERYCPLSAYPCPTRSPGFRGYGIPNTGVTPRYLVKSSVNWNDGLRRACFRLALFFSFFLSYARCILRCSTSKPLNPEPLSSNRKASPLKQLGLKPRPHTLNPIPEPLTLNPPEP